MCFLSTFLMCLCVPWPSYLMSLKIMAIKMHSLSLNHNKTTLFCSPCTHHACKEGNELSLSKQHVLHLTCINLEMRGQFGKCLTRGTAEGPSTKIRMFVSFNRNNAHLFLSFIDLVMSFLTQANDKRLTDKSNCLVSYIRVHCCMSLWTGSINIGHYIYQHLRYLQQLVSNKVSVFLTFSFK